MLGKLLKYDLRYIYKTLGVYYIITIASVACGVLLRQIPETPFIIEFISELLVNAGIGLSIGLFMNALTRTWVRFRQSLYGDEAYLTHTLPISRLQLFTSKFISAIIILLLSFIIVAIVLLLVFHQDLAAIDLFATIPGTPYTLLHHAVVTFTLIAIQSIFIIMCGFTGIIFGHRYDAARGLISAIAGFGCYFIVSIILLGLIILFSAFNPELSTLITFGIQPEGEILMNLLWFCIVAYTAVIIATFIVDVKLLNKGVNVE